MEKKYRILLVEDEANLARGLIYNLSEEGYDVIHAPDGRKAVELVKETDFDLMVLDLILPHVNGFEVLRETRALYSRKPVIILTAKFEDGDRVVGLEMGADDYLTKPFHLQELLLRIKGMLKRMEWYGREQSEIKEYQFGQNKVNFNTLHATGAGGERTLTAMEAHLLKLFIEHEGQILTRQEMLKQVWGYPPDMVTRTVDAFVSRLRSYFETNPKKPIHILSQRGMGYRFIKDPE